MSDVRVRLAEALRDQHAMAYDEDAAMYWCDCGKAAGDYRDWAEHVADVLLSLEGVAIVALPEMSGINGADNRVWHPHGFYVEQEFNGDVVINDRLSVGADELRALAAALLAAADAAKAAGGEHDPECEDRGRYDRFEGVDYCGVDYCAGCGAAQS